MCLRGPHLKNISAPLLIVVLLLIISSGAEGDPPRFPGPQVIYSPLFHVCPEPVQGSSHRMAPAIQRDAELCAGPGLGVCQERVAPLACELNTDGLFGATIYKPLRASRPER